MNVIAAHRVEPLTDISSSIDNEVFALTCSTSPAPTPADLPRSDAHDASAQDFRVAVPESYIRRDGIFFTNEPMTLRAWGPLLASLPESSVIVDPACGAGDLLLPALAPTSTLGQPPTLRFNDKHEAFVTIANKRAQSLAQSLHIADLRVELMTGDALSGMEQIIHGSTHIVMNPPYVPMFTPESCDWSSGTTNSAAVFVAEALKFASPGTHLIAILPRVLTDGSRYEAWRRAIAVQSTDLTVVELGQFDKKADVHVFALRLRKAGDLNTKTEWPTEHSPQNQNRVDAAFKVNIGSVVPHRHAEVGVVVPYVTTRTLPVGEIISNVSTTRAYNGRLNNPPFVAIRRTSRPGEFPRVKAAIVTGSEAVAVENHLIVCEPIDGSLETCLKLLRALSSESVSQSLDRSMQCRHLTKSSIASLNFEIELAAK